MPSLHLCPFDNRFDLRRVPRDPGLPQVLQRERVVQIMRLFQYLTNIVPVLRPQLRFFEDTDDFAQLNKLADLVVYDSQRPLGSL